MRFLTFSMIWKLLFLVALFLIGMTVSVFLLRQRQDIRQLAWQTDQSASAACDTNIGKVVIDARFTNTEPNNPSLAMNVKAKDNNSGVEVDLGQVNPGETKRSNIQTNQSSSTEGTVVFLLTWSDGHGGNDTRTARYGAAGPCVQPTGEPTPTTATPSETPKPPTKTPVPPTPTPVPTSTPEVLPTPTEIPPTEVLPTPTGEITGCPVPKKVQNVKIECPFCE